MYRTISTWPAPVSGGRTGGEGGDGEGEGGGGEGGGGEGEGGGGEGAGGAAGAGGGEGEGGGGEGAGGGEVAGGGEGEGGGGEGAGDSGAHVVPNAAPHVHTPPLHVSRPLQASPGHSCGEQSRNSASSGHWMLPVKPRELGGVTKPPGLWQVSQCSSPLAASTLSCSAPAEQRVTWQALWTGVLVR